MDYFDFLETRWTERQRALQVPPEEVNVAHQGQFQGVQRLIDMSRKAVGTIYLLTLLIEYALIKLRLKKAPNFISSIPDLKIVPKEPPPSSDTPPAA